MKKSMWGLFVFLCGGVWVIFSGCAAKDLGRDTARPGGSEGKDGEGIHWAASEESSTQAPVGDLSEGLGGGRFFMIAPVADDNDLHVILSHEPSVDWVKSGYLALNRRGMLLRDVDETRLPPALKGWKGKRLHVYGEGKRSCEAVVKGFAVLAEVVPHFGTVQDWEGRDGNQRRSDAEVADAIWKLATGDNVMKQRGVWLVARLDKDRKGCAGRAGWARDAALSQPELWREVSGSPHAGEVVKKFRALSVWKRIQEEFREEEPAGFWDEFEGAAPSVKIFRHPSKDLQVAVVRARTGHGCGAFEGRLWAAWEIKSGEWTLVTREETDRDFQVTDVFGSDGSERPCLLDPSAVVVPSGGCYTVGLVYEPPFYDCGC